MHLIQILLPLYDNQQRPVDPALHEEVKRTIAQKFGGLTAYTRSPAEGRWSQGGAEVKDEIVVYEIMTSALDAGWWEEYRHALEAQFEQQEIVIRALGMRML